ncbi:probable dolichyl pyrophosphate Glc1Man9GlcNAc2 alpha-1,3-glucosyltransferase isoform X1 [Diorhabda sublineata]|uniref:probable dolichyl pyrophosphate Glc1Man9GlcNAc2 alpha-1,3-glucosyltransferase isoform X1 n=2 Tax=Diorhabda sublineata TaxID=1163346 RepID=UPI0024E18536|nr:probable dolichyl pyrophosphate Glc1Man9GlcNAc2 alpha-1,3-glucosyltransferase isoform X1 [Diorhabda sublineata]
MIFTTTLLTSCLKLLLIPAYRSTDFEVHRNWLAITFSLPVKKWYFEDTSQWTLDYPPLFAWFEYVLSYVAYLFDPKMLNVNHINYSSEKTVLFQRLSVIFTDLVYTLGVHMCCSSLKKGWGKEVVLPILLITNCGLLMVDHIHFQYNGIMYGILLISVAYMFQEKYLQSAFWFSLLLNMKHIYLYVAPAYFIYLLRNYCLKGPLILHNILTKTTMKHFTLLGSVVMGVFLITYFPFYDQLPQILSRLFPFKRGLCHAYWAPNFWAIYNTVDKIGFFLVSRFTNEILTTDTASMTGGLVQEFSHSLLPNITPTITMILTALFMLPPMIKLFLLDKHPTHFLRCMVICAMTSFVFGWHVHEKAILMVIIPLSILSILNPTDAKIFLILSTVGHYSLFPLLFPPSLLLIKVLLLLLFTLYSFHSIPKLYVTIPSIKCKLAFLNLWEICYLLGLVLVFLYENVIHFFLGLNSKYPFLPLMITSVYCAIGVMYCWIYYYIHFLKCDEEQSAVNRFKKQE